jgi:predicted lipoprotein with Yx(FWY)xxD motif
LVDVINGTVGNLSLFLWRYLATAEGKALYTADATCTDDCLKDFTPYLAPAKAKASGDWSLIHRGPYQQWAYNGEALYIFEGKDPVVEVAPRRPAQPAAGAAASEAAVAPAAPGYGDPKAEAEKTALMKDPASKFFSPKKGWRRAKFAPEESIATPSGIQVKSLAVSNGYVIVNQTTDMPLYVMKTAPKNPRAWTPMYAPLVAQPLGDFTVVTREDGTKQWAYRGSGLYSYAGDYSPDDLNGTAAQADAQPALAYENFTPSNVHVQVFPLRGPLLVNAQGKTLYTAARNLPSIEGNGDKFFVRGGQYRVAYDAAKEVGPRACEGECLKTWQPLLAGPQDQSSGFWEVMDRSDGSRQWAYKGAALYTYSGDEKPGDTNGNAITVPVLGNTEGTIDLTLTGNGGEQQSGKSGSGWYWHIVTFYN